MIAFQLTAPQGGRQELERGGKVKIDKSCIDHNANRLALEASADVWDAIGEENGDRIALVNLAYIRGVMDMAEAMKKALDIKGEKK